MLSGEPALETRRAAIKGEVAQLWKQLLAVADQSKGINSWKARAKGRASGTGLEDSHHPSLELTTKRAAVLLRQGLKSTMAKVRLNKNTDVRKWEASKGSAVALASSPEVCWMGVMTCQKKIFTNPTKGSMQKLKIIC